MRSIHDRHLLLLTALAASGCSTVPPTPPPSYADYFARLPCVDRIGRCFDASIGGQSVIPIPDKARHDQITQAAQASNPEVRSEIHWELPQPVTGEGALQIRVGPNTLGMKEVGPPKSGPQLMLYPLDHQSLSSQRKVSRSSNVLVEGKPVMSVQNQLAQKRLPPGRYVISIRYRGQANWDQKFVLVEVK